MEGVSISIERPTLLSAASRDELESSRKRLRWSVGHEQAAEAAEKDADIGDQILERAYQDASYSLQPELPPLSARLRKLWSERGDFSRFRASSLLSRDDDENDEVVPDGKNMWNLGANLAGTFEEESGDATGQVKEKGLAQEGDGEAASEIKEVMSIQDMLQLRSKMMEKLGVAQNSLYFSHAMVSLLVNSTKVDQSASSTSNAARAGSPHSASAGGAARAEYAASASAIQRSVHALNVMGSAANLEAELGVEPHIFGASKLEADRTEVEPRDSGQDQGGEEEEEEENADDSDEDENLDREARLHEKQDAKLPDVEREERARTLVQCYQGKKHGIASAADILRRGARALRGDQERNKREEMRWQLLLQSKRTGWGLIPDKPMRGASKKKRELLEDGNRKRDEPSRDAWIGYAVPEAQFAYKRRALAYFSHGSGSEVNLLPGKALEFASQTGKMLQVRFVVGSEMWVSGRKGEIEGADDFESQLQTAQREMADVELFDSIRMECRAMNSSVSLFPATIDDEDSVSIALNGTTLVIELVKIDAEEGAAKTGIDGHYSVLCAAILAVLRLGLVRRYRARAGVKTTQALATKRKEEEGSQTPLLSPVLGSIHFASFLTKLQTILGTVQQTDPRKTFELHGLEKIQNCQLWLPVLLQGSDDSAASAVSTMGGSATMYYDGEPHVFITISYPSTLSLSFPKKKNTVGGRGVYLARVDIRTLQDVLIDEVP